MKESSWELILPFALVVGLILAALGYYYSNTTENEKNDIFAFQKPCEGETYMSMKKIVEDQNLCDLAIGRLRHDHCGNNGYLEGVLCFGAQPSEPGEKSGCRVTNIYKNPGKNGLSFEECQTSQMDFEKACSPEKIFEAIASVELDKAKAGNRRGCWRKFLSGGSIDRVVLFSKNEKLAHAWDLIEDKMSDRKKERQRAPSSK